MSAAAVPSWAILAPPVPPGADLGPDWLAEMDADDAAVIRKLETAMAEEPKPTPPHTGPLCAISRTDEKYVRQWYAKDAQDCAALLRLLAFELQAHAQDFDERPRRNMGGELHEARASLIAALAEIGGTNPNHIESILRPVK